MLKREPQLVDGNALDTARQANRESTLRVGETPELKARADFLEWLSDINARVSSGDYLGAFQELREPKLDSSIVGQEVNRVYARWQRAAFVRAKKYADTEWAWPNQLYEAQALIQNLAVWNLPDEISEQEVSTLKAKLKKWETNLSETCTALGILNNSFTHLVNPDDLENEAHDKALERLMSEGYKFQVIKLEPSTPAEQIAQFDIRALYNTRRYLQLIHQLRKADGELQNLVDQLGKKPTELKDKRKELIESFQDVQTANQEFAQIAQQLGETNFKFDLDALQELSEKLPDATSEAENVTSQLVKLQTTLNELVPPHGGESRLPVDAFRLALRDVNALLEKINDEIGKLSIETKDLQRVQDEARKAQDPELARTLKTQREEIQKNLLWQKVEAGKRQIRRLDYEGQANAEQNLRSAEELCGTLNLLSNALPVSDLRKDIDWFKNVTEKNLLSQFKYAWEGDQIDVARQHLAQLKLKKQDERGILTELLEAKSTVLASQLTPALEERLAGVESRLSDLQKIVSEIIKEHAGQAHLEHSKRITQVSEKLGVSVANLKAPKANETLKSTLKECNNLLELYQQHPNLPEWKQLKDALQNIYQSLCKSKWSQNLENLVLAKLIYDRYSNPNAPPATT